MRLPFQYVNANLHLHMEQSQLILGVDKSEQTLAPQQARSRESLRRLLKAAIEVLGQHGVAGTTIPRIATHAGLTPGAVYRRFRNKDVLLETAILSILEDQDKILRVRSVPRLPPRFHFRRWRSRSLIAWSSAIAPMPVYCARCGSFCRRRRALPFGKRPRNWRCGHSNIWSDIFISSGRKFEHADPRTAAASAW